MDPYSSHTNVHRVTCVSTHVHTRLGHKEESKGLNPKMFPYVVSQKFSPLCFGTQGELHSFFLYIYTGTILKGWIL